jgi:hypothetical protein
MNSSFEVIARRHLRDMAHGQQLSIGEEQAV